MNYKRVREATDTWKVLKDKKKEEEEEIMAESRAVEPFRFFKIILQGTLDDKKLRLPEKFVKKFGDKLCDVATFKVPNGCAWQMGLTKEGENIWFNYGWQDFVTYHSICVGYFLVFKYAKNSTFDVLIFDMTACEIEYPYDCEEPENEEILVLEDYMKSKDKALSSLKKKFHSNKREMAQLVEIGESRRGKLKGNEMYNSQGSFQWKRHTNTENLYLPGPQARNMDFKIDCTKFKTSTHNVRDERAALNEDKHEFLAFLEEMGIFTSRAHKFNSVEERHRAICTVKLFKPANPSFMCILRSKTAFSHYMYVPSKFANKYLNKFNKSIKLQDTCGREWPARLIRSTWCGIARGWPAFSKDQNLKIGDMCLFELIGTEGVVLKVSVLSRVNPSA